MKISIEKKFKNQENNNDKKNQNQNQIKKYIHVYKKFKKKHIIYFKISSNLVGNEVKLCVMGLLFPHI